LTPRSNYEDTETGSQIISPRYDIGENPFKIVGAPDLDKDRIYDYMDND
jgi:hypothetical protein